MCKNKLSLAAGLCVAVVLSTGPASGALHWYRGNTHTHTINSDGNSTPDEVARWYRLHGYDFLFITDHGMITDMGSLNAIFGGNGQFLVLPGEEVTSNFDNLHVHVNSLNPARPADAQKGGAVGEVLQKDVDAVRRAGGLAQINHPNFFWQLTADDVAVIKGATLLEIANMHPGVNSFGAGPTAPSAEAIWDSVLSRGVTIWGVASDDEHNLTEDVAEIGRRPLPGRGWIIVRAPRLQADELMKAIGAGDFYASTGVELEDYEGAAGQVRLKIRSSSGSQTKYRIEFVGRNGRVLQDNTADSAIYMIKGDEGYVRTRITDSNGKRAWTQPVFVH
jgi:hypothetical protein